MGKYLLFNSMEKAFYNLQNLKSIPEDTEGCFFWCHDFL